jgi:hypothetical protein
MTRTVRRLLNKAAQSIGAEKVLLVDGYIDRFSAHIFPQIEAFPKKSMCRRRFCPSSGSKGFVARLVRNSRGIVASGRTSGKK